jgi:hypothetical protein
MIGSGLTYVGGAVLSQTYGSTSANNLQTCVAIKVKMSTWHVDIQGKSTPLTLPRQRCCTLV